MSVAACCPFSISWASQALKHCSSHTCSKSMTGLERLSCRMNTAEKRRICRDAWLTRDRYRTSCTKGPQYTEKSTNASETLLRLKGWRHCQSWNFSKEWSHSIRSKFYASFSSVCRKPCLKTWLNLAVRRKSFGWKSWRLDRMGILTMKLPLRWIYWLIHSKGMLLNAMKCM